MRIRKTSEFSNYTNDVSMHKPSTKDNENR